VGRAPRSRSSARANCDGLEMPARRPREVRHGMLPWIRIRGIAMDTSHVAYKAPSASTPAAVYLPGLRGERRDHLHGAQSLQSPIRSCGRRVMMNRRNPEIVVIDPLRNGDRRAATLHVALAPKATLPALWTPHLLIAAARSAGVRQGAYQRYEYFAAFVKPSFTPARTAGRGPGVPGATLPGSPPSSRRRGRVLVVGGRGRPQATSRRHRAGHHQPWR